MIPFGTYILCNTMKYYPLLHDPCPDILILLVGRCLVPSARSLYAHEACDKRSQATGELVAPPDQPHLAPVARLYHGVEATSCQVERNFSSLPD